MVKAAGGLISYLQNNPLQFGEINPENILQCITKMNLISFEGFLQLDMNTLQSLSIFTVDSHPCKTMKIGLAKEGISLFGILNKTMSSVGKETLRKWFLQPILDLEIINSRYEAIEFFSNPDYFQNIKNLREKLKNIKNIDRILKRMNEGKSNYNDLINFYKTLFSLENINQILNIFREDLKGYKEIQVIKKFIFNQKLLDLLGYISETVDLTESKEKKKIIILPGVDEDLDKLKNFYDNLERILNNCAEKEREMKPELEDLTIVFYPQFGYLVCIPKNSIESNQINGYHFSFESSENYFFKSQLTNDLDIGLGDLHSFINDKESILARNVETEILQNKIILLNLLNTVAELDCLLSFTISTLENNYTKPQLSKSNIIKIINGRNPLQEKFVETFIPNDTNLEEDKGRLNIITGPNNSGKSVYLKQVGLIVYMSHIGCFIPADKAIIGNVDKILTRIYSNDSMTSNQSTFTIDLNQINTMIQTSTEKSLLLIDEFGKGTLALDGLSLLGGTLKYFLSLKEKCPKILCCTHYTEILEYKLIHPDDKFLQFSTMDVLINEKSEEIKSDDLTYLFKLVKGKIVPSYGTVCAELCGIPMNVIQRAKYISEHFRKKLAIEKIDSEVYQFKEKKYNEIMEKFKKLNVDDLEKVREFIEMIKKE